MSRIILLDGPASVSKAAIAAELQRQLEEPFLLMSLERLADQMLEVGRVADELFVDGFQRSLAAMADAGNEVIVDHHLDRPTWRESVRELLKAHDVFLVGVDAEGGPYDLVVSGNGDARAVVSEIAERFLRGVPWTALHS